MGVEWSFPEAICCVISQQIECRRRMRIQLSSIKPEITEICKNIKQGHSCLYFALKNFFYKNASLMLSCNEFIIALLKIIRKYLKFTQFYSLKW